MKDYVTMPSQRFENEEQVNLKLSLQFRDIKANKN